MNAGDLETHVERSGEYRLVDCPGDFDRDGVLDGRDLGRLVTLGRCKSSG